MGDFVRLLDYIPVKEVFLTCLDCKRPWPEFLPEKATAKSVNITCPWCAKAETVENYVPRRLR